MKPALLAAVIAIALLLALWVVPRQVEQRVPSLQDTTAGLRLDLSSLRAELASERTARQILESEVALMREVLLEFGEEISAVELDPLAANEAGESEPANPSEDDANDAARVADAEADAEKRAAREKLAKLRPIFQLDQLIATGILEREAERVREIWQQIELDKLELRDLATREKWLNSKRYRRQLERIKREAIDELGECGYDSLLYGTGKKNRVVVRDVLAGSNAERAGLEAGDIILRYNEKRVWAARDLQAETSRGERNDTVLVDVERGGQKIYLRVDRGPLGLFMDQKRVSPDGC